MTSVEEKAEVTVERVIAEVQPDATVLVMFDDGAVSEYENVTEAEKAIKKRAAKQTGADEMRVTEIEWRG